MDAAEPTREGGAAGRSSQPLLLHRAAADPGERGAWRPLRGPPSSATTLPSSGPVADGRERGREVATNLLAYGGRRRRKREEVWARPEARSPEKEGPKGAPWEGGVGREENGRRPKGGGEGLGGGRGTN
jgi:hypothetical protein